MEETRLWEDLVLSCCALKIGMPAIAITAHKHSNLETLKMDSQEQ